MMTVPDGGTLFANDPSADPEERVDRAETALHRAVFDNEAAIRLMLSASLARTAAGTADDLPALRQNRRTPLIEAALAPARGQFKKAAYDRLVASLAMIFGSNRWSCSAMSCGSTKNPRARSKAGPCARSSARLSKNRDQRIARDPLDCYRDGPVLPGSGRVSKPVGLLLGPSKMPNKPRRNPGAIVESGLTETFGSSIAPLTA